MKYDVYTVKFDSFSDREYSYLSDGHEYRAGDIAHVRSWNSELKEVTICGFRSLSEAELPVPLEKMKSLVYVEPKAAPEMDDESFWAECTVYAVSYRETGPIAFKAVSDTHEYSLGEEAYVLDQYDFPSLVTIRSKTRCYVRDMAVPPEKLRQLYDSPEEMGYEPELI